MGWYFIFNWSLCYRHKYFDEQQHAEIEYGQVRINCFLIQTRTENLHIKAESSFINYSMSARNLGLILDNTLGMEKQVNFICNSCYYQIRNIGLIRKYINDETCNTLVQAIIIYRLDYANALLYNIPPLSDKPPRASSKLRCTFGDTHAQKVTYNTSFVPVRFRTLYKILFHTFKVLSGSVQHYRI